MCLPTLHLFLRDKIERSSLTGENRQVILHGVQYPFAMTVFQQDIFWTDWTTRSVHRARKDDGSGLTAMTDRLQYRPNDIHVFAESKQESCSSPCQQFNGGCSHICVPGKGRLVDTGSGSCHQVLTVHLPPSIFPAGPTGPECQCPQQGKWYLTNNGKDCIQDNGKRCQPEQFTCLNGDCITPRFKCDGFNDCADKSDELERVCGERLFPH